VSYRSADSAVVERIAQVETDLTAIADKLRIAKDELGAIEADSTRLRELVEKEGPGGGLAGASSLQIPVILTWLLVMAFIALPGQLYIGSYVHSAPGETVMPLVISAGPAVLTIVVAWNYRKLGRIYPLAVMAGLGFLGVLGLILLLGFTGVLR
jgi:hypothetical protein